MIEWESANTYLRETDYTTYEAEKAKVMNGSSYGATSSQPYRTLVHSDYNYYYDGKGNLIGKVFLMVEC